jgi:signal transduction histidine kinase
MIIGVLVRRWFPDLRAEMERQRRVEALYAEVQEAHQEAQQAHEELQKTHDELQQAHDDLTRAQETRDALTHMIVHDMRTPLTNIITGLQTVQQFDDDAEVRAEFTQGALAGANRLLTMVNDLLDISKMEAGEMALRPERFLVADVLQDAAQTVDVLARDKGLTLQQETAPAGSDAAALTVEADRDIARRVLVNLVGNAIKFTPPGGTITLRAEPDDARPDRICVSVSDTGVGIPPEHQARVFDKFYQVRPGATGGVAATGLGLAFCKMAAEAHGGQIGLESTPGEGSRFYFTLPAAGAPAAAAVSAAAGAPAA